MCIVHIEEHFLLCYKVKKITFIVTSGVFRWSVYCYTKAQKKCFYCKILQEEQITMKASTISLFTVF